MRMKQYDSYKESGVEWIGKVPSHWEIMPLKFTGTFGNGLTYSPKDVVDNGILVLRSSNIQNSSLSFEDNVYVSNVSKVLLVQKGDVIICSRNGSAALVGKSAFIDKDINATFGAFMMRYIPKINKKYGFYLFQTAIGRYKGYFATTTINQLTKSTIGEMKVPLANTEEQTAIVDFLDNKCSEIDKVISAQQKRIALLQELKQSVITHAVTKGLNPNVEMDATEEDWINRLPASWGKAKLKYYIHLVNGRAYSQPELLSEGKYKVLRVGNFFTNDTWYYSNMELEEDKYCNNGDLLYAWSASFGPYIWNQDKTIYHYHIWKVCYKECMDKMYVYYLLKAITNFKLGDIHGSTMVHITMESMNNSVIPIPSFDEQKDIATFLDKKCASIDNALTKAQHQVELLQKYKQSLITEVVTGKRKVC